MISWGACLLSVFVALWFGFQLGHRYANMENAEECRRLGGFFVGRAVFKCVEIVEPPKGTVYGVPRALYGTGR